MFAEINPAFLAAALFFLTSGCYLYLSVVTFVKNSESKTRNAYLSAGFCLFLYSLFYGFMTITVNETLSRIFWSIGFTSGCLFFSRWLLFTSNMVAIRSKVLKRMIGATTVITVFISALCVFSNDAVFIATGYGTQFSYQKSLFFIIALIYISILIIAVLVLNFRWWRKSEMKRDRTQAFLFIVLSFFIAPIGFSADFIIPTVMENTAIPLASICFLPVSMPLFVSIRKYKTLGITVPNASGYVFNTITLPTLVLDHKNIIGLENEAAIDFLGRSVIGKNISKIILAGEKTPEQSFFRNSFSSEKVTVETPRGGRICDMLLTIENDKYKDPLCKVVLLRDITENEHKDIILREALENANSASKAKSHFLSNMSHEMRSPLNAVIGMINIGINSNDIDKMKYCFERADSASKHLLGVINDILDMSKIEAEKFELSRDVIDFEKMLMNITNVANFRVEEKRQNFTIRLDKSVPAYIESDELRLSQVITNLLSNAVKFTPEKGSISLNIDKIDETADGLVTLRTVVSDTGIGISKEQQERLFTSFNQADANITKKFGGTGLGLAISKRIVELMDGEIWIESELGQGAKFIFTIKVNNIGLSEELKGTINGLQNGQTGRRYDFHEFTLLIAEDVEINREIIGAFLDRTGVSIDFAETGKTAVSMFSETPDKYNLILMDVNMPEIDGYEATRQIRALDLARAKSIPIIAMTANVFRDDVETCIESGMNDHIGKPIDADTLFGILDKYLKCGKLC